MERHYVSKPKSTKCHYKYFDIDGIICVLSTQKLLLMKKIIKYNHININMKKNGYKKPLNKNLIYINGIEVYLKNTTYFYLQEIPTIVGRVDIYLIINKKIDVKEYINNFIHSYSSKKMIHSYSHKYENSIVSVNFPLSGLLKLMRKLEKKEKANVFLYGEKFGSKHVIYNKNDLLSFYNEEFKLFCFKSYDFDVFEFDFTLNIMKENNNNYFTQLYFRKDRLNNKNYLEKNFSSKIYQYNVLNEDKYVDLHGSSGKLSILV